MNSIISFFKSLSLVGWIIVIAIVVFLFAMIRPKRTYHRRKYHSRVVRTRAKRIRRNRTSQKGGRTKRRSSGKSFRRRIGNTVYTSSRKWSEAMQRRRKRAA